MRAGATFLLGQISLAALGAGAVFHPEVRPLHPAARLAAAFGAGSVFLAVEATVFSIVGIPWTIPSLSLPLLLLSAAAALSWRNCHAAAARSPVRIPRVVAISCGAIVALSLLYLGLSLISSSATSVDFLFFWGVKAVRFANARGLDATFLRGPFTYHAVPDYPPLLPVAQAWGCLLAGRMPWLATACTSLLWAAAAIPLIFEGLRGSLGDRLAGAVAAFWSSAMCVSLANSYSGGNAEAPLLFFESAAVAWLLGRDPEGSGFVVRVLLCGAAMTKVEGSIAVLLIAAGVFLRSRSTLGGRLQASLALAAWPALGISTWFLYQASRSLPVGFNAHGRLLTLFPGNSLKILQGLLRNLEAGSLWLPWIFAVLWIVVFRFPGRVAVPAACLSAGLLLFLVFDYLHDRRDPTERIGWTAPRVAQPALSATLLAAGLAAATSAGGRRRAGESLEGSPPDALREPFARIECRGSQ